MFFVRFMDHVNGWLQKIIGVALGIATISVFIQIIVRFVLPKLDIKVSVPWTEELARYLIIWCIFIGAAVAARKAKLIAVEALVHAVPVTLGKVIKYSSHIVTITFFTFMFIIGIEWAKFGFTERAPVLQIPLAYVFMALSVGSALIIMNTVALIIENILEKKDIRIVVSDEQEDVDMIQKEHEGAY